MKNIKIIRIICFPICFLIFSVLITILMPDPFSNSYQRVLVTQYDYLNSIEENKIVFIGNSSLAFGFDQDLMEKLTGKPCPILGNNAGHGLTFPMEMSKSNLRAGDAVVIEFMSNEYNRCGVEYLLTGIGNRYDMYKIFFPQLKEEFFSGYISSVKKRFENCLVGGIKAGDISYTKDAFSDTGAMALSRQECLIPFPYTKKVMKTYGKITYGKKKLDPDFISYINSYTDYCNSIGVDVYFTLPCYMDEAVFATEEEMDNSDAYLASQLKAPLISKSKDYIFERKYMYNAVAHCNTEGAAVRTRQIYQDLKKYVTLHKERML